MYGSIFRSDLLMGTISGTILVLACSVPTRDLVQTVYLAIIGALTSYAITHFLKWIHGLWKNRRRRKTGTANT